MSIVDGCEVLQQRLPQMATKSSALFRDETQPQF
jgi:hypothetical protein